MTAIDDWLQALAAAGKGGTSVTSADVPPATRGIAYSLPMVLAGDWTGATISGSISASPDAASPLATFTVSSASYDSGTGMTTWTASLTGSAVTGLPADTDGNGTEQFPAMFRITPSGGAETLLFGCVFTVIGKA